MGQTQQVRKLMEPTDLIWAVVPPGLEDYLLHQLHIRNIDGTRVRVFDTSAHQTVGGLIADLVELSLTGPFKAVDSVVADLESEDDQRRRLDPGDTLHSAGVRDGDHVLLSMEEGEWSDLNGHVFISYAHADSRQVDRLQRRLEVAGLQVWRDTADLMPGQDWRVNIRRAITEDTLVFLACFSAASLARSRSYQNEELILAIDQMRLRSPDEPWLIPVRFDECSIPDRDLGRGRTLSSIQYVDLFGTQFDQNAAKLIEVIKRILGHRQADLRATNRSAKRWPWRRP